MEVRPNFLEKLHENGFHVSGVVYDKHLRNVYA